MQQSDQISQFYFCKILSPPWERNYHIGQIFIVANGTIRQREHSLWERITLWLVSGRTLVLLLIHGSNLSGHTASKYASSIWTYTNSTSKTFYSTLPLASNKTNPIRSVILTIGNYFHGIDKIQKSIQVSLKFRLTKLHVCHPSRLTKNCAHIQDLHTFF